MQFVKKNKLVVLMFAVLFALAMATAAIAGFGYDLNGDTVNAGLESPQAVTASAASSSMDLAGYEGAVKLTLYSAAGTGTSPTLNAKVQTSPDDSTWTDVSGATFSQITNAASSLQSIGVDTRAVQRYIRVYYTVGGTSPSFTVSTVGEGFKQYRGTSYQ